MTAITTITGRLVKDPVIRQAGNTNVIDFAIAVNTSMKDAKGEYITNFYDCEWFAGKLGDQFMLKCQKGTIVEAVGESVMQTYYSNKLGREMNKLVLKVYKADPIANMRTDATKPAAQPAQQPTAQPEPVNDEELPF